MTKVIICVTNDLISDQRVHKVSQSLLEKNYDVTLVGRKLKNSSNITRKYNTLRFRLLFNKGFLFYASYNIRLFFFLIFSKYKIYISNDLDTLPACYYASKIKKSKLIFDSHELFSEVPELINRKFVKNFWLKIEKKIYPKLKYCYTVCDSIANIYNQKYKTDFKVVRNIPLCKNNINENSNSNNEKIILYQGSVNIGRGLKEIIDAMQFINNAILLIVGTGDIYQDLVEYTKTNKLNKKVFFKGRVKFEDLLEITRTADLGISLEQNLGLNYYYSLPNKIFDYIHSNVPILASDLPEIKNIILKYNVGELVNDFSQKNLAYQVNNLLGNNNKLDEFKKNTKLAAKELCWQNEVKTILDMLNL